MTLPALFNCSNDMALAANVRQYQPPKRIQQMESDLAGLAKCWDEGPWGWSLATKQRYKQMGISDDNLPSDEWLANVRRMSSRQFACGYIQQLLRDIDDTRLVGHEMRFVSADEFQCATFNSQLSTLNSQLPSFNSQLSTLNFPLIFKSPWSSSGRGVFVAESMNEKIVSQLQGFASRQGGFAVDKFHTNKAVDFAMEFFVHENQSVDFLGYSVFHAAENGAYGYNYVESQERLKQRIGVDGLLHRLVDYHRQHLAVHGYHGPVGIDMIRLDDGRVHPCIEINVRMNMGILALKLWDKHPREGLTAELTPPRQHGFQAHVRNGLLEIIYNK